VADHDVRDRAHTLREAAADELAGWLEALADTLAGTHWPAPARDRAGCGSAAASSSGAHPWFLRSIPSARTCCFHGYSFGYLHHENFD
jgi:hypothetical protein